MMAPPPQPADGDQARVWEFFGSYAMQRNRAFELLADGPPVSVLAAARLRERVVVRLQRGWGYGRGTSSELSFSTSGFGTNRELMHARRRNRDGKPESVSWKRGTNHENEQKAKRWMEEATGTPEPDAPGREVEEGSMTAISPVLWRKLLIKDEKTRLSDEEMDAIAMHLARAMELILRPWLDSDDTKINVQGLAELSALLTGRPA